MKQLILLVSLMFSICANAQIDSLSYAAGHQSILGLLAGDLKFIETEDNIKELYRGVEDNLHKMQEPSDSTHLANYFAGFMQGVFFTNSLEHMSAENRPPVNCIIDGLRMIAENKLTLPQDSIRAKKLMESIHDSINPVMLPPDERCNYFTAYGILKGMPHGLEKLLTEYGMKRVRPVYCYYAQGFADILEILEPPQDAYDYGKKYAQDMRNTMFFESQFDKTPNVLSPDFLSGVRAALKFEPAKLTEKEIDSILKPYYASIEAVEVEESDVDNNKEADNISLSIVPNVPYEVNWSFEAYTPILYEDCPKEILDVIVSISINLQSFGIKAEPYDFSQIIYYIEEDNPTNYYFTEQAILKVANEWNSKNPSYCKFFCGKDGKGNTIFGVSNSADVFTSNISNAIINPKRIIEFHFGDDSTRKTDAARWAEFTKKNIGRFVVCQVNDKILMCPKVNSEITSGACTISGTNLSNSEITDLFAYPIELDEIDIIEIQ